MNGVLGCKAMRRWFPIGAIACAIACACWLAVPVQASAAQVGDVATRAAAASVQAPLEDVAGVAAERKAAAQVRAKAEAASVQVRGRVLAADNADALARAEAVKPVGQRAEDSADEPRAADRAPVRAQSEQAVQPGTYLIVSAAADDKVLTATGSAGAQNANVQLGTYDWSVAQHWQLTVNKKGRYALTNKSTNAHLTVVGGAAVNGANATYVNTSAITRAQRWVLKPTGNGYTLRSALDTRFVLDCADGSTAEGTNVQLWRANGTTAQTFRLIEIDPQVASTRTVENGVYTIATMAKTPLYVGVEGQSVDDGANVAVRYNGGTSAQRWNIVWKKADKAYRLVNVLSGKALDVAYAGVIAGTNIWQYASNDTLAQRWAIAQNDDGSVSLTNMATGMALALAKSATVSGTNVQCTYPDGGVGQTFLLKKAHLLPNSVVTLHTVLRDTGVVDVPSASTEAGTQMQVYDGNGTFAQKFVVKRVRNDVYTLRSVNSGLYLADKDGRVIQQKRAGKAARWAATLFGGVVFTNKATGKTMTVDGTAANGTTIATRATTNVRAQRFTVRKVALIDDGYYEVANRLGKVLDVADGSTADGANIQLYASNSSGAQAFYFKKIGGYYLITNLNSSKALDVADGSTDSGANVQLFRENGTDAQLWKAAFTAGGYLTFTNKGSGKKLSVEGGAATNGANVVQETADGSHAQQWRLDAVDPVAIAYSKLDIDYYWQPSLYHGVKTKEYQRYIVLHDTEGMTDNGRNVVDWWLSDGRYVAAHFIILRDGRITQCVPMDVIGHHAGWGTRGRNAVYGVSDESRDDHRGAGSVSWSDSYGMNSYSIGIELVHEGQTMNYPSAQLIALDNLIAYIDAYYGKQSTIIDHKMWREGNSDTSAAFAGYLANYRDHRTHN